MQCKTKKQQFNFINFIRKDYSENIKERYGVDFSSDTESYEIIELIGKKRGFVIKGGETDTLRTSNMIIDEFRSLKLGKISLEKCDETY